MPSLCSSNGPWWLSASASRVLNLARYVCVLRTHTPGSRALELLSVLDPEIRVQNLLIYFRIKKVTLVVRGGGRGLARRVEDTQGLQGTEVDLVAGSLPE